jgi:choline-sulfatase
MAWSEPMRILALLAVLALPACSPGAPEGPNLLLVSLDTTRFDHTSLGDYERDTTPRLRALAAEGASFDLAYAPTATTGPTHATLFTSRLPRDHGVVKNGVELDVRLHTLAEHLASHGWRTAAFVSSYVMSARWGWQQGFGHFDDAFEPEDTTYPGRIWEGRVVHAGFDRRAAATTARARAWLESQRDGRPFFLFVHYYDPHAPYVPPEPFSGRFPVGEEAPPLVAEIARYDEEIAYTDSQVGVLLDALDELGLSAETLVIVTADHGEGLMDHGHMAHGAQIYEEQVRVPLLVRLPGVVPADLRDAGPAELLDVAPTALELMGVPGAPERFGGRSLAAALRGEASLDPDHPVRLFRRHYAEREGRERPRGEQDGVRLGRWKYIERPSEGEPELYDLEADPGERRNLIHWRPDVADRLAPLLATRPSGLDEGGAKPAGLSDEEEERLRALGYVE